MIKRPNGWPTNKDRENWPSHIKAREPQEEWEEKRKRMLEENGIDINVDFVTFDNGNRSETPIDPNFKGFPPLQQIVLQPTLRKMDLVYGTPLLYKPKKLTKFINVGKRRKSSPFYWAENQTIYRRISHLINKLFAKIKFIIPRRIKVEDQISAFELSKVSGIPVTEIITITMSFGEFISINQKLDIDFIKKILKERNIKVI